MALLTPVSFPAEPSALDLTAVDVAASAGGDTFKNVGRTGFYVANAGGASRTVTFDAPRACNHGVLHDSAVVVPNGFVGFIARSFDATRFNNADGVVSVTYSAVTGLTVAAVRLE